VMDRGDLTGDLAGELGVIASPWANP
jgi:hypothetical protein